jgi:hypothetical protein
MIRAILPATRKKSAAESRILPEIEMPVDLVSSHAVNGHAEIPEKRANQPFVRGSRPFSIRSMRPPPPARIAHVQAAAMTRISPALRFGDIRPWPGFTGAFGMKIQALWADQKCQIRTPPFRGWGPGRRTSGSLAIRAYPVSLAGDPMFFRDFYQRHPHGASVGGVILLLLIVISVVVLVQGTKD